MINKFTYFVVLLIFAYSSVFAQIAESPYKLTYKKEIPLIAVGGGLMLTSHFLKQNKQGLTVDKINLLNRNDIWRIDRPATYNWSTRSAKISDILLYTSVALPLLHLTTTETRTQFATLFAMQTEVLFVTNGITGITKELVQRKRPFTYNPNAPLSEKLKADATSSFFSGHTSNTSAMSFFYAKTYSDFYPQSKLKPYIWTAAALYPAITGFLRWRAGKHFLTDIAIGYVVGAVVGVGIPALNKRMACRN